MRALKRLFAAHGRELPAPPPRASRSSRRAASMCGSGSARCSAVSTSPPTPARCSRWLGPTAQGSRRCSPPSPPICPRRGVSCGSRAARPQSCRRRNSPCAAPCCPSRPPCRSPSRWRTSYGWDARPGPVPSWRSRTTRPSPRRWPPPRWRGSRRGPSPRCPAASAPASPSPAYSPSGPPVAARRADRGARSAPPGAGAPRLPGARRGRGRGRRGAARSRARRRVRAPGRRAARRTDRGRGSSRDGSGRRDAEPGLPAAGRGAAASADRCAAGRPEEGDVTFA